MTDQNLKPAARRAESGTPAPRAAVCAAILWLLASLPAAAHTGAGTVFADIAISGARVQLQLTVPLAVLPPELQPAAGAPASAPLLQAVAKGFGVRNNGSECSGSAAASAPTRTPGAAALTFAQAFDCGAAVGRLTVSDRLFERLGKDHLCLAKVHWDGGAQQFAFSADNRDLRLALGGEATPSGFPSFVALGIEHILTGYDHLLFLLALLLRGGNLWSVLKIVTAFTLAHSITLALAALEVVNLPPAMVEAAIAASIAYVAAENLFLRAAPSRRWLVSFAFGLIHGFGFSAALRELDLERAGLVLSLLGFNVGVELGQAAVVALAIPVLLWLRRRQWEQRVVPPLSWGILLFGAGLFLQRALFP